MLSLWYPDKMKPGEPYCERCDADVFPRFPKVSERHVGARVGVREQVDVFVGETKLLNVYEAYENTPEFPGRFSWMIRGVYGHTVCPKCGSAYLKTLITPVSFELRFLENVPTRVVE